MDIFEEIKRMRREMDKLFDSFLAEQSKAFSHIERGFRMPVSDVRETDDEVIVRFEIPGVNKEDINLEITEDTIKLRAQRKAESRLEKEGYFRAESSYKGFYQMLTLPCKVIPERARAEYKNGVLEVRVPKAEKKKEKKAVGVEIK